MSKTSDLRNAREQRKRDKQYLRDQADTSIPLEERQFWAAIHNATFEEAMDLIFGFEESD